MSVNREKRTRECKESRTKFQATIAGFFALAMLLPDENCEDGPASKAEHRAARRARPRRPIARRARSTRQSFAIGSRCESLNNYPTQCEYTVWYAASVGSAVKEQRRAWSMTKGRSPVRTPAENATYELTAFKRAG